MVSETIEATNNHVNVSMDTALDDYNSKVLPEDRITDIREFFDDI